jgi:hypothetical protein
MAHKMSGRLPVRLVMMNALKQTRIRCRVIRHQQTAVIRCRTGGDGGGDAGDGDNDADAVRQSGVVGQFHPSGHQDQGEGEFGGPPPQGADYGPDRH